MFQKTDISALSAIALEYLRKANVRTPGTITDFDFLMKVASKGYGEFYEIYDKELVGAMYVVIYKEKKVICPVLVGGKQLHKWRNDLYQFLVGESDKIQGTIRFIARLGWSKKYPMCKKIGSIYELKSGGGLR